MTQDEEKKFVTIEWVASPVNDMYADAVLTCVLQADNSSDPEPPGISDEKNDTSFEHFKVNSY